MTDWNMLRDAYGPATEVPDLLLRLTPDADETLWTDLWSRLCHQGTVYPASFAALPELAAMARKWSREERLSPLLLAAAIIASDDFVGPPASIPTDLSPVRAELRSLALESLEQKSWPEVDLVYLLQAVLAFEGVRPWGNQLDRIVGGELVGNCPGCGDPLYVVLSERDVFAATEDWVNKPPVQRAAVHPPADDLPRVGRWLATEAVAAGHFLLAARIPYLFGTTACPACGGETSVPGILMPSSR